MFLPGFPGTGRVFMAMQIIEWPRFLEGPPQGKNNSAIAVGVFDGVHRGHQALIAHVCARKDGAVPVLVTFRQRRHKNAPGENPGSIMSFRQKMAAFERLGIAVTVVIEFTESFMRTSGTDFLQILLRQGGMGFLAVGSNFRCGHRLDTDARAVEGFCSRLNIPAVIVPVLTEGGKQISSSRIRSAVSRGELKDAAGMLGCPFTVDLAGVPAFAAGNATVYDISGQDRLLPPPGKYAVYLLGGAGPGVKTRAEILVEGGNIIVEEGVGFEYVEFLPA